MELLNDLFLFLESLLVELKVRVGRHLVATLLAVLDYEFRCLVEYVGWLADSHLLTTLTLLFLGRHTQHFRRILYRAA